MLLFIIVQGFFNVEFSIVDGRDEVPTKGLHTEHSIPSETSYALLQFGMDFEPPSAFFKLGFPSGNRWMS